MYLERIALVNYRNYELLDVKFPRGVIYLYGKNGVGKTNLLEAIYYLSNLESFRSNDEENLVKDFNGGFSIEGRVDGINYRINVLNKDKDLKIDGIEYKKYREYIGNINVIGFIPEEVYLFKDSPKERRRFLDKEISKVNKEYLEKLLIFNNLLKQRNELLKKGDLYQNKLFEVLDEKMAELQVYILKERKKFLSDLEKVINELSDEFEFKLVYDSFTPRDEVEAIKEIYQKNYQKDKDKQSTGVGIHRDDFRLLIGDIEIANYASQGEQRYCVLLLKLGLAKLIKERINKDPIIILDDVFSELDRRRKKKVYEIIKEFEQVFLSGCQIENLEMHRYTIKDNKVTSKGD